MGAVNFVYSRFDRLVAPIIKGDIQTMFPALHFNGREIMLSAFGALNKLDERLIILSVGLSANSGDKNMLNCSEKAP